LQAYAGGRLTESLATLVLDTLRRRDTTKTALARAIGVEHPQIIRALNGSRGLSRSAAANLKRWLAA
jgi:plasmid maintenance system antidote protein VapI